MDILAEIEARLKRHPHILFTRHVDRVWVAPTDDDGFDVGVAVEDGKATLYCDGWQWNAFDSHDQLLALFGQALTRQARLRVDLRGRIAYGWQFEVFKEEVWMRISRAATVLFPFWLPKRKIVLQNHWLESLEAFERSTIHEARAVAP